MYFPVGWPKIVKTTTLGDTKFIQIVCNRDKILFAILTNDSISIWFCKPCVPISIHRRNANSLTKLGYNVSVEWKPDSSQLVIATSEGHLLFYNLEVSPEQKGLYVQTDSPHANLRRDSAELFIKETIPSLYLTLSAEVKLWDGQITCMVCITVSEFMVATTQNHVLRFRWDGTRNRDYDLDLRRIPFCINQQVSKAIPIVEDNTYIVDMEYSPLIGGFAIVFNDGRAAFLTASSLKFDPNQVQGIWAQNLEDATSTGVNHKYRLIAFGKTNSEVYVYYVDDSTGGLEVSHVCMLSSKDYPGCPGAVTGIRWTPDGCVMVVAWDKGGIAMWSTFGAILMCSLGWDYGLDVDIQKNNPLLICSMEWSTEGYQLWMINKEVISCDETDNNSNNFENEKTTVIQLDFVKSALTVNPCMSHQCHLYLQGEDKLFVNSADILIKMFSEHSSKEDGIFGELNLSYLGTNTLAEGRQWLVIPVPSTYSATNWPIRYSAVDREGQNISIAGRTGLAHYSLQTRKWKLFGNETQEKDFIVVGGLLWWRDYIVMGCYSIIDNGDELRFYPRDSKLDNKFAKIIRTSSPVLLVNSHQDQLITFGSDAQLSIWSLKKNNSMGDVSVTKIQAIDVSALCVHPACIVSVSLTALRSETGARGQHNTTESLVLNISGRLLMVQRESRNNGERYTCSMPTVLASCVENVWVPCDRKAEKLHLTESLWLFCGAHGMRVWLPLYPRDGDKSHSFMSKRIMLPFHLRIYPLAILFEDAIILGAENDTVLYTSDLSSPFSLPFSVLRRTSQVYLHQILRQLIRRNLGYHAWEIARSCTNLPYFPHSLELLLHEVLEEEATSKEPIPDAQLPSVIEFIMEFPVYLQTVVQCARKTEIALWPYLFSAAGKPKDLFQECMIKRQLDTAASYLIILQNLEASSVSRQYATLLLDTALDQSKWELAKDLVRFLRAIDPNDVESPRNSFVLPPKLGLTPQTPPVTPNADDLSLILGNVQGSRVRSYSTTISPKILDSRNVNNINVNALRDSPNVNRKKSAPTSDIRKTDRSSSNNNKSTAEEFFIDVILQRHARRLISMHRLTDLGYFAAHLDFHLVAWLAKERDRAARVDDFVKALKQLHEDFDWPYPVPSEICLRKNIAFDSNANNDPYTIKQQDASSRVGDSGYTSLPYYPPLNSTDLNSRLAEMETNASDEAMVRHCNNTKNEVYSKLQMLDETSKKSYEVDLEGDRCGNVLDESAMSTVSSVWLEEREVKDGPVARESWEVPSPRLLEELSVEGVVKGSQKSEVQLRYLLQLFMEAGCLEWTLLISVLLKDLLAVLRTINAAKSSEQSIESISRLKKGLQLLHYWTHTECLGYKSFMMAIQNQIPVLSKILAMKIQQEKQLAEHQEALSASMKKLSLPTPSRSRKTSTNQDSGSGQSGVSKERNVVVGHVSEDVEENSALNRSVSVKGDPNEVKEGSSCVIS